MFQMTKMNPNWLIGIMSATTTYNRRTTNPDPVLLIRAMIAMITTRKSGNATTTVTNDSASIPSVSIFFRISRRSSFSNCSAFTRKYGLSWPPLVEVVTTPWRKSENFEDGERCAAFRIAVKMSRPSSSVSRVIHSASRADGRERGVHPRDREVLFGPKSDVGFQEVVLELRVAPGPSLDELPEHAPCNLRLRGQADVHGLGSLRELHHVSGLFGLLARAEPLRLRERASRLEFLECRATQRSRPLPRRSS